MRCSRYEMLAQSAAHGRKICSSNPLEGLSKANRGCTNVVGIFPGLATIRPHKRRLACPCGVGSPLLWGAGWMW